MLFPTLSLTLLGLATVTAAAPHLHSRFENEVAARQEGTVAARGIQWLPRGLYPRDNRGNNRGNNRNKNNDNVALDITITEVSNTVIDGKRRNDDIQLVQIVQQRLIIIDNSREFADNIRRNTFRNKNNKVNTVVIIVTVIVDERDNNNKNKRYLTRQIESNKDIEEQVIVVISESNQFTIGPESSGSFPTGVSGAPQAESTGSAQNFATYDPNAEAVFQGDGSQSLLPFGAEAPKWDNAQYSEDPAIILLENPGKNVFVSFENENYNDPGAAITIININSKE